jgi:hypothetical protein
MGKIYFHPKGWVNAKPLVKQWFFLCGLMNLILDLLGALGNVLVFPFLIFHSGVLRQGSDKFYSLSFQAPLSLLVPFMTSGSPAS